MNYDIKNARESKGFSQGSVAEALGISRQTYARIETGDSELTLWQAMKLAQLFDITLADITGEDIKTIPGANYDIEKYKAIITQCIRYGADDDGKITKTKLAKLAYLVDFGWFYDHLVPLTGLTYLRRARWPVPDAYFHMLDYLQDAESISIENKGKAQLIENIETPNQNGLSDEELTFIKQVCAKWKGKKTDEIVRFTHDQLPWKICRENEIIPYELIIQEKPDHIY